MKKKIILGIFLLFIFSSYNNCGDPHTLNGTEIGNPYTLPLAVQSTEVLDAACSTLNRCYPGLNLSACESGLLNAPNVPTALGLAAGAYSSFGSAQSAESQGALHVNSAAVTQCISDLSALSCNSTNVTSSFNPASPTPFAYGALLFPSTPGSCSSLY